PYRFTAGGRDLICLGGAPGGAVRGQVVRLQTPATRVIAATFLVPRPHDPTRSPNGRTVAEWDRRAGLVLREKPTTTGFRLIRHVFFDGNGRPSALGIEDGAVRWWDMRTGRVVRHLWPVKGEVEANSVLAISPNGRWLAACGYAHPFDPQRKPVGGNFGKLRH